MTNRYRANFLYGTLSGFNATQTTFTGTGFPNVPTGYYLPIVINPGYQGGSSTGEIVYVTAVTSGTIINVSGRAFENTTAITGSQGTPWIAGPLVSDFGIANSISNGDFPTPASGGQYFTSVGTTSGQWTSTIPGSTVSGYSANVSITGTQISGTVASATTAANFTGTLNAATITGGNLPSAVQVSGSSIVGSINVPVSGTIAASNITAATWQSNVVFPGTQISGTISANTITAGASGQVLTTSGSSVVWSTPVIPASVFGMGTGVQGCSNLTNTTTFLTSFITLANFNNYMWTAHATQASGLNTGNTDVIFSLLWRINGTSNPFQSLGVITGGSLGSANGLFYSRFAASALSASPGTASAYDFQLAVYCGTASRNFSVQNVSLAIIGTN